MYDLYIYLSHVCKVSVCVVIYCTYMYMARGSPVLEKVVATLATAVKF